MESTTRAGTRRAAVGAVVVACLHASVGVGAMLSFEINAAAANIFGFTCAWWLATVVGTRGPERDGETATEALITYVTRSVALLFLSTIGVMLATANGLFAVDLAAPVFGAALVLGLTALSGLIARVRAGSH